MGRIHRGGCQVRSRKAVQEDRAREAQDKEAAEKAEAAAKFKAKADKIDGFAEKLAGSQVWFPNAVLEYITESDDGPEIVMHMLDNPETADRISKLRPIKAIAEIGKLQKTLGQAKAVEPRSRSRGAWWSTASDNAYFRHGIWHGQYGPAKMSFRELREYERAKRKKH